jgi:hypothetical protein
MAGYYISDVYRNTSGFTHATPFDFNNLNSESNYRVFDAENTYQDIDQPGGMMISNQYSSLNTDNDVSTLTDYLRFDPKPSSEYENYAYEYLKPRLHGDRFLLSEVAKRKKCGCDGRNVSRNNTFSRTDPMNRLDDLVTVRRANDRGNQQPATWYVENKRDEDGDFSLELKQVK